MLGRVSKDEKREALRKWGVEVGERTGGEVNKI